MSRGINMNILIFYGSIYEEIILQTWWWSREKNDNGPSSQMFSFMMILQYSKPNYKNGIYFLFQSYCLMSMISGLIHFHYPRAYSSSVIINSCNLGIKRLWVCRHVWSMKLNICLGNLWKLFCRNKTKFKTNFELFGNNLHICRHCFFCT